MSAGLRMFDKGLCAEGLVEQVPECVSPPSPLASIGLNADTTTTARQKSCGVFYDGG